MSAFLRARSVQGLAVAILLAVTLVLWLGRDGLPFTRPSIASTDVIQNLIGQLVQLVFALFVIFIAFRVTRKRQPVDFFVKIPARRAAMREMIGLLLYGILVILVGGLNGIGMHLHGSLYGPTLAFTPRDVYAWAAFNFIFFAVIPYFVFRLRGYDHRTMWLKSEDVRSDVRLIITILIVESIGELFTFRGLFSLDARQLLLGVPLTFVLHLFGTGIPVMIFAYSLLFPRYLAVTGSGPAAIVCGALTYAGLHLFEYWTVYDTPTNALLSVAFIFLQFMPPGLVKSFLTWRTGNAWVHLWAYHAVAPHVTVDTPHIVRIFGIR